MTVDKHYGRHCEKHWCISLIEGEVYSSFLVFMMHLILGVSFLSETETKHDSRAHIPREQLSRLFQLSYLNNFTVWYIQPTDKVTSKDPYHVLPVSRSSSLGF